MGIPGLWDVLKPAAKIRSMTDLAIKEGFEANPDGKRGFRLGVDISIWFYHAEYGREGENPGLRTLFFRCATLMRTTFLPIFVFDGPRRPVVKRGKRINQSSHKLIPGMKQIVEAFGFEWRMAPGEAEAELAYLNRVGLIDGILSDDVDNFLFGSITLIRNLSHTLSGNRSNPAVNSEGKNDKNHTYVFRLEDITNHPDIKLTRGGMILIGLMSGGDYQQGGLKGCGITTSHALAKCGFGDRLYEASRTLGHQDLTQFLVLWRQELREELRTDSQGYIGRRQGAMSRSIPEDFPDIDTLLSYVCPITSESMGKEGNNMSLTWSKEPNLAKLAETCEFYFEWGYKEAIIKRFRSIIWDSIVLRILRRAVLNLDEKAASQETMLSTPRKKKTNNHCGTPSKMIAKHFSSIGLVTPTEDSPPDSEDDGNEDKLILRVHSTRVHTSTDGLLEYRLEIAPKQLVKFTESGIKGIRVPESSDEWASDDEINNEVGPKRRGRGRLIDPETPLRVWMPACMLKLAEPGLVHEFEDREERKGSKKGKKAHGRKIKNLATTAATKQKHTLFDNDLFSPTRPLGAVLPTSSNKSKAMTARAAPMPTYVISVSSSDESENDSSDPDIPSRLLPILSASESRINPHPLPPTPFPIFNTRSTSENGDMFTSLPISSRVGIKDLTKKKPTTATTAPTSTRNLKLPHLVGPSSITPKETHGHDQFRRQTTPYMTRDMAPDSGLRREKSLFTRVENPYSRLTPIDFRVPYKTNLQSTVAKEGVSAETSQSAVSVSLRSNTQVANLDDFSGDDCDSAMWAKDIAPTRKPMPSSPSKRKTYRSTNSTTESETPTPRNKYPRKTVAHTSPQSSRWPASPPVSTRLPISQFSSPPAIRARPPNRSISGSMNGPISPETPAKPPGSHCEVGHCTREIIDLT